MLPNLCGRLFNSFINSKQNFDQKLNIKANLIEQKAFFQALKNLGIVANHIKLTTTTLLDKTKLYIDCSRIIFPSLFSPVPQFDPDFQVSVYVWPLRQKV